MFIRLLLASLILVVLGQTPLVNPLQEAAARVSNPLQYGTYRFSQNLKRDLDFVGNLRRLYRENLHLNEKVSELESSLAHQRELERENKALKEQLAVSNETTERGLVLAQVVGRSSRGGEAILTVNQGTAAGVVEGAAVVSKNFLLGEVIAAEPQRSQIRLLTDSSFSAAALDQESPDRTRGLVRGQYGTAVMLERILPTEPLVVGDTIVTSGEDGKFAKGLILGRVRRTYGQEADVFKSAELELMVNLDLLEEVFIYR
jgi:rod shape-determining protein MreC